MTEDISQEGPDFIIGGAMKSGTSSVHSFLGSLSDVYIPDREIFFFDIDDVFQHPDFHYDAHHVPDFSREYEEYRAWYLEHFRGASAGQLVGEDSTTYLASRKAPGRIKRLLPNVRLIFILRDPVARCYSHYWHLIHTRRTDAEFAEVLSQRYSLIQRSCYGPQLRRYFQVFDEEQIFTAVFEQLLARPSEELTAVCHHIGVEAPDRPSLPHRNPSGGLRSLHAERLYNRLTQPLRRSRYRGVIPGIPTDEKTSVFVRASDAVMARINRTREGYGPMEDDVEDFLIRLLRRENEGLRDMLDTDLGRWWKGW